MTMMRRQMVVSSANVGGPYVNNDARLRYYAIAIQYINMYFYFIENKDFQHILGEVLNKIVINIDWIFVYSLQWQEQKLIEHSNKKKTIKLKFSTAVEKYKTMSLIEKKIELKLTLLEIRAYCIIMGLNRPKLPFGSDFSFTCCK